MKKDRRFVICDENGAEIEYGTVGKDDDGIVSLAVDGQDGGSSGFLSFNDALSDKERKIRQGENMAGWSVMMLVKTCMANPNEWNFELSIYEVSGKFVGNLTGVTSTVDGEVQAIPRQRIEGDSVNAVENMAAKHIKPKSGDEEIAWIQTYKE